MVDVFKISDDDIEGVVELSYMVGELHDNAMPEYFNRTSKDEHLRIIKNMMDDKNACILVAKDGSNVIGFACLYVQNNNNEGFKVRRVGYIYNFGVDEKYRRKGVGKKLIENVIEYFKNEGCGAVDLSVFMFNGGALDFYKKLGFEIIDVNMRMVLDDHK